MVEGSKYDAGFVTLGAHDGSRDMGQVPVGRGLTCLPRGVIQSSGESGVFFSVAKGRELVKCSWSSTTG